MGHRFTTSYRLSAIGWFVFMQFFPSKLPAQDDLTIFQYIPDIVTLNYSRDNDHGRETFVMANFGLTLKDRLIIGVGEQTETVTRSEEALDNETYQLGYTYLAQSDSNYGVEYEHWGDNSKVTTDSLKLIFSYNFGKYAVSVTPQYQIIEISNDSQCDEAIYSRSARADLSVDFNPEFTFLFGYAAFDYSDNLSEIIDCVATSEALGVESRVESVANDSEVTVGLDYYVDTETYGVSATHANTALNSLVSRTVAVYASTDKFDDWTLTATAGITENTDDSTTLFMSGTVTYYW